MEKVDTIEERILAHRGKMLDSPEYYASKLKVNFADAVAWQLKTKEIKKSKIAETLNVKPPYVTKLLRSVMLAGGNLTMESMAKLAYALGVEIELKFAPLEEAVEARKVKTTCSHRYASPDVLRGIIYPPAKPRPFQKPDSDFLEDMWLPKRHRKIIPSKVKQVM